MESTAALVNKCIHSSHAWNNQPATELDGTMEIFLIHRLLHSFSLQWQKNTDVEKTTHIISVSPQTNDQATDLADKCYKSGKM